MKTLTGFLYYPDSLEESGGITYFLVRSEEDAIKYLGILGNASGFEGGSGIARDSAASTHLFPLTHENAAVLRQRLPWLRPQPLGLRATIGFGDRLGLATPGYARALEGSSISPVFAQQSAREIARAGRTAQDVFDYAMWGVFQSGWHEPWGADADHLQTTADIDAFYHAGYTFYTLDSSASIDNAAQEDPLPVLRQKVNALRWDQLNSTPQETAARYLGQSISVEDFTISYGEEELYRALAKYGDAIGHAAMLAAHLKNRASEPAFDLEISVDESDLPATPEEHFLIASELKRLGVLWTSFAPHLVGRFEKGADYTGSLPEFEDCFARHAAIARHFGNYRLSLHNASDKYRIYPIIARQSRGLLHLKTAGSSYLEALRVTAQVDPDLFRKILALAVERYRADPASYGVSAAEGKFAAPGSIHDHALAALLDQVDARQILRVTYAAALDRFGPVLLETLRANENTYYEALYNHVRKLLGHLI